MVTREKFLKSFVALAIVLSKQEIRGRNPAMVRNLYNKESTEECTKHDHEIESCDISMSLKRLLWRGILLNLIN